MTNATGFIAMRARPMHRIPAKLKFQPGYSSYFPFPLLSFLSDSILPLLFGSISSKDRLGEYWLIRIDWTCLPRTFFATFQH